MNVQHHVMPGPKGGWDILKNNGVKSIKHFENKLQAVRHARIICRKQQTEMVVHRRDGSIQSTDNYSKDIYHPKFKLVPAQK
jgi:hypothetical protein